MTEFLPKKPGPVKRAGRAHRPQLPAGVPPLRVQRQVAATALGISTDVLDEIPFELLPWHKEGRSKLYTWADLARYVERERKQAIEERGEILADGP